MSNRRITLFYNLMREAEKWKLLRFFFFTPNINYNAL